MNGLPEAFGGLFVLVFAGLSIACAAGLASWMVEPINRVAGHLHLSTRFMLIDFIGLMLLIQTALAVVGSAIEPGFGGDGSPYWQILSVVVVLVIVLWAAAVSVVSRAGITRMLRRLTVMVVLIPADASGDGVVATGAGGADCWDCGEKRGSGCRRAGGRRGAGRCDGCRPRAFLLVARGIAGGRRVTALIKGLVRP